MGVQDLLQAGKDFLLGKADEFFLAVILNVLVALVDVAWLVSKRDEVKAVIAAVGCDEIRQHFLKGFRVEVFDVVEEMHLGAEGADSVELFLQSLLLVSCVEFSCLRGVELVLLNVLSVPCFPQ